MRRQTEIQETVGNNLFASRKSCHPHILRTLASGNHEGKYWSRPESNIPIGIQKFAYWRTLGLVSAHNQGKTGDSLRWIGESNFKVVDEYNLTPEDIEEATALADAGFSAWCTETF